VIGGIVDSTSEISTGVCSVTEDVEALVIHNNGIIHITKFSTTGNIFHITLEEIETILWKKMRIFSRTTEKEAAEMCEKISCYYVEHKTNDVSVEDILNQKN
jgi:hypothetical protein